MLLQASFSVRSVESPLSATSLKNCSNKASLDCQPSALRIDESLSPTSLDSVIVAEKDAKCVKYSNASPINSPECLDADQVGFRCPFYMKWFWFSGILFKHTF